MFASGTPEKQILIEHIFAQGIQSTHGKTFYGFDVLLSSIMARHLIQVEVYDYLTGKIILMRIVILYS